MATLTPDNITALNKASDILGVYDPRWLRDLVYFETAGTFDPKIKNMGGSSGRGLIQFMDATARGMGYTGSQDLVNRYPDFNSQLLGPVVSYLKKYGPFTSEHQLYMAVFYPKARRYAANTPFKDIVTNYPRFIKANPGILTPAHYVALVKKKPLKRALTIGSILAGAGILSAILYLNYA